MKHKRTYITPLVEFEEIDPDTGICTDISAHVPDNPWDDSAKRSDFVFDDEFDDTNSGNMFGDAFAGDVFDSEFNL